MKRCQDILHVLTLSVVVVLMEVLVVRGVLEGKGGVLVQG